jgi:hypothetical protein
MNAKRVLRVSLILMAAFSMLFAAYACVPTPPGGGCNGGGGGDTADGPYATAQEMNSGAGGQSGVFYPRDIASASGTFPVLVFGCGAGSNPTQYVDHGNNIASYGFIVIITASDNGGRMNTNAINWIIQQNSRAGKFQGKVNTGKIAAGGHSMGSIGTFAMADDPRLTTTVHVAGGSFDGQGPDNLKKPTIYISGTGDMALSNCRRDYQSTTVPVFFTVQQGVDHIACAREGLPAIVAWLQWHLKGETQHRAKFLERGGEFTVGKWDSQSKNW